MVGIAFLFGASGNLAEGNWVGLNATGTAIIPNYVGIGFVNGAADDSAIDNVVSGNQAAGVFLGPYYTSTGSNGDVVQGNLIGTDPTGTFALGNSGPGVNVTGGSSNNTIGGTTSGAGNLISANAGAGVSISGTGTSGNLVLGNEIGTDIAGTVAIPNTGPGVVISGGAAANTIGGDISGARNVISGNAQGVIVTGTATADTLIAGNLIGTDVKGAISLPNQGAGIDLASGTGTTIGGTTALSRNIISGNDGDGIDVASGVSSTLIEGNYIGADQTGAKPLANTGDGISVGAASGFTIGGTVHGAGNVISANSRTGVSIIGGATGAMIIGNLIGTDESGTSALGNGTFGVFLDDATGVLVGGTVRAAGNVISANAMAGIGLYAGTTGTLIEGNFIGTDTTGTNPLGNGTGILIDGGSASNTIGGTVAGAGNTIAFSAPIAGNGTGIGVDVDATAGAGNTIRLNSIFSDEGLGIAVASAYYENYPVLNPVQSSNGTTTVSGTLNSLDSTTFFLDFYTITSVTSSGYGEGRYVLGSAQVTTNSSGTASFSVPFPTPAGGAQFVTVTATDSNGNTSEFSKESGTDIAPSAVMSFSTLTVDEGMPVTFDASGSSSPIGATLTYSWSFGDLTTGAGPTPTHTYTAPGTNEVVLTVSDGFGGTSTATATITVVNEPPQFTANSFTAPLTFATPSAGSGFGASVASVTGNVAVGAPEYDSTGAVYFYDGVETDTGVVYAGVTEPEGGSQYAYGALITTFNDPNPVRGDEFGASLAVVGSDLIVGAPGAGNGVVYVFDADIDDPNFGDLLATIAIPDASNSTGAQFGASVGATDTNILIGAPGQDGAQGEVYEYEGDPTQSNFGDPLLAITNPVPNKTGSGAQFGAAVTGLGNNIVVGAPDADAGTSSPVGTVSVFDGNPGDSTFGSLLVTITNPDASAAGFGSAVAAAGSNIVIGSPLDNFGMGKAFLYSAAGSMLTTFFQPGGGGGNFGAAVAGSETTAVIGAPLASLGTGSAGAVYVFDADPADSIFGCAIAAEQEPTPNTGDLFGTAVSIDNGALVVGAASVPGSAATGAENVNLYQGGGVYGPGALVERLVDDHLRNRRLLRFSDRECDLHRRQPRGRADSDHQLGRWDNADEFGTPGGRRCLGSPARLHHRRGVGLQHQRDSDRWSR